MSLRDIAKRLVITTGKKKGQHPSPAPVMRMLREHPEIAFGVHLSVICDMPGYRWGPLTPEDKVPSLIDGAGHFHGLDRLPEFLAAAKRDELKVEFRAQIEAVRARPLRRLVLGRCRSITRDRHRGRVGRLRPRLPRVLRHR